MNGSHQLKVWTGILTFLGLVGLSVVLGPRNGQVTPQDFGLAIEKGTFVYDFVLERPAIKFEGTVLEKVKNCESLIRDGTLLKTSGGTPYQQITEMANVFEAGAHVSWYMWLPQVVSPGTYTYQAVFWCDVQLVGKSMYRIEMTPDVHGELMSQVGGLR